MGRIPATTTFSYSQCSIYADLPEQLRIITIMKRILNYPITKDAAGFSILQFLKQKHYSRSVIIQLKKTRNGILINDRWAYVNHILKEGELLTIQLTETEDDPDRPKQIQQVSQDAEPLQLQQSLSRTGRRSIVPVCLPFSVLYEDEDLLVIDKPAGMPVHPSIGHETDTLANAVCYHAMQRHEYYPYRCINRLDRDTSGLTIIAKNAYSSCILYEQMRERKIQRIYYAIADGMTPDHGTINAPIARQSNTILARTVDAHGEPAVTHFQTLAGKDGLSFLKLWLDTGRTHQIRVHLSHIGHPLIGDFLYYKNDFRMNRQALHAGNLSFAHPVTGKQLQFSAPLPEDMLQFFQMVIS